jgi:hypothetical protein
VKKTEHCEEKFCKYCERAKTLSDPDTMLCGRHGVVPAGHSCRRFRYDPLKRTPNRSVRELNFEYIEI